MRLGPLRLDVTTLRWGILGPGRIAPRMVRAVGANARSRLVAVASRDEARAATFAAAYGIPRAFESYQALLDSPDVDVVYIALPNHVHADWSVRALEAGKHVLCEKPLALTVAEVDAIARAAARTGRIAVEAFMYLHHPQIRDAVDRVRRGDLGPLQVVVGAFSFLLTYPGDPRIDPAMGGGSLWDVGCYPVSFARRVVGEEPTSIHAFARLDERGVDRTFAGQLQFPSGVVAQFDCGFAAPDRQRLELVGSGATLTLEAPFLTAPDGPPPGLTRVDAAGVEHIAIPAVDQYALEVDDLVSAILDGTQPHVDLEFSRGTIATLVALDRAARERAAATAA
jgi:xylose dehydrogenase (NAD/NADP)